MEVADVFVVNKADRDGADRTVHEVLQMLEMGEHGAWIPPIVKTVARTGDGVEGLRTELARHREFLSGPAGASRRRDRTVRRIETIVQERLLAELHGLSGNEASMDSWAGRVEVRTEDPFHAAQVLLETLRRNDGPAAPKDGVRKISHLGLAVASVDGGGSFWDLLGLPEEHREEVASQKVLTSFRPVGESALELLEPTAPESPIAKYLEKKGPGLHHVCLEVSDVAAMLARLKAAGVRLVNETPFEGAHGCLVAFVHPAATGGVLLELSQPGP
jgi:methylmalonyl-CoA/ethylmalonyl-CoA epimerase